MALSSAKMCFMAVLQFYVFLFQTTAGQSVSNWGAWGECSKDCDGEQTRTRECITSTPCGTLEDKRECSTNWCLTLEMIVALAIIAAAILTIVIVIIALLCRIRRERIKRKQEPANITHSIERMYDDAISTRSQSMRHFPSVDSFPEPLKEPEELGLDSFAFDTESLAESIREVSYSFGADEEYQPQGQAKKEEEKRISLKVVSVTETQAIGKDLEVKDTPPPVYAVVMKPRTQDARL
ncbi:uncharacterized protein LOC110059228 [Orbicella faveolata]|uniref:uncharacterized protein LOC110059228 n=1 Tax=Orbicella faveolata TaxID=48498 RepID=UPI0009E1C8AA|nr:uncharacterized protein LOC110059228 [Orbicella faveolata]XP_020621585.1 uncharacterized protein LOC110059228 [Orbicella faveolata]XP_020621586.1 uncharacterized protein LOC110059228 [Orbicella faveolata]XP_020621587.1 uncharacterized protein LOC110059228 [Orbicella faveolata]XP_020621588.1 uncharacterized protein LOC110059228 [Orbicella faveolata]